MKLELAPSILSFNHAELGGPVKELVGAGADWIHCDIMDGQFVPPITFGAGLVKSIRSYHSVRLEAHLMTLTPERHFDDFIRAGCERIIFHHEVSPHAHRLAQSLRSQNVKPGIAINPGTDVSAIEAMLPFLDMVLVMTVNPGWGGQSFIRECLSKVRRVRQLCPEINIQVDGGMDLETIKEARDAGANVFVAGSFIAEAESPAKGLEQLRMACESS